MAKTLILMQGIPASGKSTVAHAIRYAHENEAWPNEATADVLSTDDFWNVDGRYVFVAEHLAQAHAWNQRRCAESMMAGVHTIIIDNTNIRQEHADPYILLARMFGYAIQVVRVECSFGLAMLRNNQRSDDRKVPYETMKRMYDGIERLSV